MVDHAARRQLALLLRRYASRRIDERQLVDGLPWQSSGDPAVVELCGAAGFLEEDYVGTEKPTRWSHGITRRDVARWVLFLLSEEEYRWRSWKLNARVQLALSGSLASLLAFWAWWTIPSLPWYGAIIIGLLLAGTVVIVTGTIIGFCEVAADRMLARCDGSDRKLWPFFNAEQYARVAARHPFGASTSSGSITSG